MGAHYVVSMYHMGGEGEELDDFRHCVILTTNVYTYLIHIKTPAAGDVCTTHDLETQNGGESVKEGISFGNIVSAAVASTSLRRIGG